jgi:hypothetical protein
MEGAQDHHAPPILRFAPRAFRQTPPRTESRKRPSANMTACVPSRNMTSAHNKMRSLIGQRVRRGKPLQTRRGEGELEREDAARVVRRAALVARRPVREREVRPA